MARGADIIATNVTIVERDYPLMVDFCGNCGKVRFGEFLSMRRVDIEGSSWLRLVTDEGVTHMLSQCDVYLSRRVSRTPIYFFIFDEELFVYSDNTKPSYLMIGKTQIEPGKYTSIPLLAQITVGGILKLSFCEEK
jgi:hypothetical protein